MVLVLKKGASKKQIEKIEKQLEKVEQPDLRKYCGSIKLKSDPLEIQKNLRNEWN